MQISAILESHSLLSLILYNSATAINLAATSNDLKTYTGVSQRSALEPIQNVNDLPLCVEHGKLFILADDTIVIFNSKDPEDMKIKTFSGPSLSLHWINCNKIKLNIK